MIEPLKDDDIIKKVGGRFRLTSLMQKRWVELMQGSRPMVEAIDENSPLDVITQEILESKIEADLTHQPAENRQTETVINSDFD